MILPVLIAMVAGWMQRHQQRVITSLQEENRILAAHLDGRRLCLTDTKERAPPKSSPRRLLMPKRMPKQGNGTPTAKTHQTAVWLTDEETGWIDARLQEIKKTGWRGVTRSAFIHSLIRTTMQRALDVSGVTSEGELAQRLSLR